MSKKLPIFLGLLLTILSVWLLLTANLGVQHLLERLEHISYDLQLRTSFHPKREKSSFPIVIVDIDDDSLKAEGRWPWARDKMANLIDNIQGQNAAVIAFDGIFAEKEANMAETVLDTLNKNNNLSPQFVALLRKNESLFDRDAMLAKSLSNTNAVLGLSFVLVLWLL